MTITDVLHTLQSDLVELGAYGDHTKLYCHRENLIPLSFTLGDLRDLVRGLEKIQLMHSRVGCCSNCEGYGKYCEVCHGSGEKE